MLILLACKFSKKYTFIKLMVSNSVYCVYKNIRDFILHVAEDSYLRLLKFLTVKDVYCLAAWTKLVLPPSFS